MPEVTRKAVGGLALTLMLMALGTTSAWAKVTPDGSRETDTEVSADVDGNTVSSSAGVVIYGRSKNGSGESVGPVASTTTWTPPACYYAPKYSPAQLQKYLEPIWEAGSTGYEWDASQRRRYVGGGPYKDFNKEKAGKGYWWSSYVTEGREGDPGALDCDKPFFWVDIGDPPPADIPEAITPEVLAQLA